MSSDSVYAEYRATNPVDYFRRRLVVERELLASLKQDRHELEALRHHHALGSEMYSRYDEVLKMLDVKIASQVQIIKLLRRGRG